MKINNSGNIQSQTGQRTSNTQASLRDLGGTGKQIEVPEDKTDLIPAINAILTKSPAFAAQAVKEGLITPRGKAIAWLAQQGHLSATQQELITEQLRAQCSALSPEDITNMMAGNPILASIAGAPMVLDEILRRKKKSS